MNTATVIPLQNDQLQNEQQTAAQSHIVLQETPALVSAERTYLITGGLGGLGLQVAEWLVQQGAKHLVLVSRRTASSDVLQQLETLKTNAEITVAQADVAQQAQLAKVINDIDPLLPLSGVIHAAGVLDDGVLLQLNWQRMAKVMAPKVLGAWNLHTLTQHKALDFFVLFSSAASLLGSPGQANHVAANAFLDALAPYRQSLGLPGLSINWGAWSNVGAAANRQVHQQMNLRGIGTITPQQGLFALEQLMRQSIPQVGVIPIDWSIFIQQGIISPFVADFLETVSKPQPQSSIVQQLIIAAPSQRHSLLMTHLQIEVGKVLGLLPPQLPNPQQGFFDMGLDSLMTVELKNRLETSLGISLTPTVIFEHPNIRALAQHITDLINLSIETSVPQPQNLEEEQTEASILAELEELETLLRKN